MGGEWTLRTAEGEEFGRSSRTMMRETNERNASRLAAYLAYAESAIAVAAVGSGLAFFVVFYSTGALQPWGTVSDLFGALFALLLLPFLLEVRRIPMLQEGLTARIALSAGLLAWIAGGAGSVVLVWGELGGPGIGAGTLGAELGLSFQFLGFGALLAWCVVFGLVLRTAGWSSGLWWGVVGATFVGLPAWFAWLGRTLHDSATRPV